MIKILIIYTIVVMAVLACVMVAFFVVLSRMVNTVARRYDDLERTLLGLRDGTKYFYLEKRRSFRIKTDMLAHFADKATGDDYVKIHDISYDGAFLKTTQGLKAGETVKLDIYLPFFPKPVYAEAKVIRASSTKEIKGMSAIFEIGAEFTKMSGDDREKLVESINILNRMPRRK